MQDINVNCYIVFDVFVNIKLINLSVYKIFLALFELSVYNIEYIYTFIRGWYV